MPIDTADELLSPLPTAQADDPRGRPRQRAGLARRRRDPTPALRRIWDAMRQCVFRGCHTDGILPGGLGVVRRAAAMSRNLLGDAEFEDVDDWMEAIRRGGRGFREILAG